MENGQNKKPDNVVYSEEEGYSSKLPYTTKPAIKTEDVDVWKQRGVNKVNSQLKTKFNELKEEYHRLVDEYRWNELAQSLVLNQ